MITLHVNLTVHAGSDIPGVKAALAEHADRSRAEPGCERFDLYQSELDPHVFFILEEWNSQAELETHRVAESFRTVYEPKVLPYTDRSVHTLSKLSPESEEIM